MRTLKHTLLTSACAFLALPVSAQDVFDLGEITVFSNQTPTQVARTGVSVDILDATDLQTSSSTTAADTLSRLPGVSVSTNGGLGKQTNLRIRGLSDRYVGVRINGIDVTDPASVQTQFNWGGLTTSGLSRVEVLKGSQSALYGSEAIGGVVNITTSRVPDEIGTVVEYGLEIGSYSTVRGDFTVATRGERGDISFTYARIDTDGFSAADENDGNTEEDGFESDQAFLSAGYALTESIRVGVDLIYFNEETNIDAFGGPGGDADRPFFTDRRGARAYAEVDGGLIQHTIEASYFQTERLDPLTPFGSPFFEGERTELRYSGVADLDRTTLAFGAEYSQEEALFTNGRADYDVFSVFGEAQYAVNANLDVSAALRVDDHSEFGTEPSGRLALAWRPQDGTIVRASLGTGFRAPSLNELFGPFNTGPSGFPDLDPEKSRSAEVGIEHAFAGGITAGATLFYTEIDDLIQFVTLTSFPAPFTGEYSQQDGTSRTRGLELTASAPLGERATLFGNYTYTNTMDVDGSQFLRVPEHDLLAGVTALITDRLSADLTVNYIGDRIDGFPAEAVDDYTLVNATLSYAISDRSSVYLRLENLTDREYQTAEGFGTSDRAVFVGLRASF
jgi:vitamin B12 transporter